MSNPIRWKEVVIPAANSRLFNITHHDLQIRNSILQTIHEIINISSVVQRLESLNMIESLVYSLRRILQDNHFQLIEQFITNYERELAAQQTTLPQVNPSQSYVRFSNHPQDSTATSYPNPTSGQNTATTTTGPVTLQHRDQPHKLSTFK